LCTPNQRKDFLKWIGNKGIVTDDLEKIEEYIIQYKKYRSEKAFDLLQKRRENQYKKNRKEFEAKSKPKNWWKEQGDEGSPPPEDEGGFNIPWYDKDGFHERGDGKE